MMRVRSTDMAQRLADKSLARQRSLVGGGPRPVRVARVRFALRRVALAGLAAAGFGMAGWGMTPTARGEEAWSFSDIPEITLTPPIGSGLSKQGGDIDTPPNGRREGGGDAQPARRPKPKWNDRVVDETESVWAGPIRWDEVNASAEAEPTAVSMSLDFDALEDLGWDDTDATVFKAEGFNWEDPESADCSPVHAGSADFAHEYHGGISLDPGFPRKPCRELPGDVNRGACPPYRYQLDDDERAGLPRWVLRFAKPSLNQHYSGWYVGGGAAFGGRGRCPGEGVWGMDYQGWFPVQRVWMNWTGGRVQGGEGAYQTDGHVTPTRPFRHGR
ncbi:MAG: hypothetical protein EA381_11110 [Planctomycetaceae bacterium]|nr:MAG: hypothetical protein EA381_11110 [Planctomycetaceae bacterium]